MWYLIPYRKQVVITNLKKSFPEKSESEIQKIAKDFYHHFCDIGVETIKTFSISEQELRKRFPIKNQEVLDNLYREKRSIVGITGHYGNWEWAALAISLYAPHKTMGIYKPLKNKFWNKTISNSRGKFGLHLVPIKKSKRFFEENKNTPIFSGFIADQRPGNIRSCYWTNFLNQDTPVYPGPEKTAKVYNHAVLYGKIKRIKRGYYELEFEEITQTPQNTKPGFISEKHTNIIEQIIKKDPAYWLWTHKRWKKSRPSKN